MDITWLLAAVAMLSGVVASSWSYIQSFASQLAGRLLMRITVTDAAAAAVAYYVATKFERSKFSPHTYHGDFTNVHKLGHKGIVVWDCPATPKEHGAQPTMFLYWCGWRPVFCKLGSSHMIDRYVTTFELVMIRGVFEASAFVTEAVAYYEQYSSARLEGGQRRHKILYMHGTSGRMSVVNNDQPSSGYSGMGEHMLSLTGRPVNYSMHEIFGEQTSADEVDQLALAPAALAAIGEARFWRAGREWYAARGLPWQRGFLFYGPPGCGKTAISRAIAKDLDLPVGVFDLPTMSNDEMRDRWALMQEQAPCMILLEDFDTVFNGRDNIVSGDQRVGLTFDALLQAIDGIAKLADGVLLIVTTNNKDALDSALLRPGRIDRQVYMPTPDYEGKLKMAARILPEHPEAWAKLAAAHSGTSGAEFQDICATEAKQRFFNEVKGGNASDDVG